MNDKSIVFKKNEKIKVEANIDVEISKVVEDEVREAVAMVIEEASKKYYRNITVDFSVKLK